MEDKFQCLQYNNLLSTIKENLSIFQITTCSIGMIDVRMCGVVHQRIPREASLVIQIMLTFVNDHLCGI